MEDGSNSPTDPLYNLQWYLKNTGQLGDDPGIDINVEKVWDDYNGTGVTVGVYDDGVETAHPDLAANYNPALQPKIVFKGELVTVNGEPLNNLLGADSHGTAVAGIIAASTNNVWAWPESRSARSLEPSRFSTIPLPLPASTSC
jgi:subtilisin family serine protease